MPYEYWCGACRTVSEHSSKAEAEAERHTHIATVHHGRRPDRERLQALPPVPGPPIPASPLHQFGMSQGLALVAVVLAVLVAWALYLDPPASPHPPPPSLPTPQPWASLFASTDPTTPAHPGP
ncbi:hypothetical protein [Kitasatospora sp. NPDC098663]|uniref:hypothetical protein n=1 Tax=Kitasatospora sp. NPDC098663 TaxID=3364096 RepID=UPI00382F47E0